MRVTRFDRGVAPAQRVVVGVADLRCVLLVIQQIMMRNLARQMLEFRGCVLFGQLFGCCSDGGGFARCTRHAAAPSKSSAAARAASVTVSPASMRAISSRRSAAANCSTRV